MKFNAKLLVFAGLILFAQRSSAFEKSREITKEYKVNSATTLELVNKYGNIKVIPWQKDSIKITVSLKVKSNNEEKLDKLYENVDFEFIQTPGFITARTMIGGSNSGVWTDISTLTKSVFTSNSDMSIHYTVYLPEKNKLVVENKYGDLYIGKMLGSVKIDLSHGNLKATSLLGNSDIVLKYGKGTINEVKHSNVELEYSDFNLEKAEKLSIESKSGEITLGEIRYLNYESRRGDYHIHSLEVGIGNSSFTNVKIEQLVEKLYTSCTYGDLKIMMTVSGFTSIDLKLKFSDADIYVSSTTHYQFNANHQNSTITFPQENANLTTIEGSDESKEKITSGKIGAGQGSNSTIRVEMERSELNLYSK